MFRDFIMERTQADKKAEMEEFLKEAFKPPEDGNFDPESFQRNNEIILSMLTPEGAEEMRKMMNPFGDEAEIDESLLEKNWLEQPNKLQWDDGREISRDEMREAFACSKNAGDMECDCWNTHCQFYGNCRKCIVFHLCLKQFPTCQRALLGEYEDHYIVFSQDQDK
jgi:hypothetical protein